MPSPWFVSSQTEILYISTVYVRDASGNVMAVYETESSQPAEQKEIHLYGSSRLGMVNKIHTRPDTTLTIANGFGKGILSTFTRGAKVFELINHLGNVLATVSDKRMQHTSNGTTIAYYTAEVVAATDYYPFGMTMPGRNYSSNLYRYGFNTQERSSEINENTYTAEYWQYDARIGRRWNLDVIDKAWISSYATLGNCPIMMIDPDGADWYRNNKTKEAKWFDGKGEKGYTYVGKENEVVFREEQDLDNVTVSSTTKKKSYNNVGAAWARHMSAFNHTAAEAAQWKIDRANFDKGNYSALTSSQIAMYKRSMQANKDWRQMSIGAVGAIAAPFLAVGAIEAGAATSALQGSRWLFQQGLTEGRLIKEGATWLGRKYGRSFLTEVGINYFQNGMVIKKMDAFDIFTNTLNPYRQCLKGRVLMGGVNSVVDVNLFATQGQRLNYIGNGKSFSQAGLDFSFGLFNEGAKYTFGTLSGNNANREFILDVIIGNAGGQAIQAAEQKK